MKKTLTHPGGRLGNQLYRVLHTYIRNTNSGQDDFIYMPPEINLYDKLCRLGCSNIITLLPVGTVELISFHYHFGLDFEKDHVTEFIRNFILKSDAYKNANEFSKDIDQSSSIAIHIRNTDYLVHKYECFDREKYINDALSTIHSIKSKKLYVFSDDIEYTKLHYGKQLENTVEDVHYTITGSAEDDLMKLATFRNKVIFNSTFSVWSAMIGNAIYQDSETSVIAPAICWVDENSTKIYNPAWNLLKVKIAR